MHGWNAIEIISVSGFFHTTSKEINKKKKNGGMRSSPSMVGVGQDKETWRICLKVVSRNNGRTIAFLFFRFLLFIHLNITRGVLVIPSFLSVTGTWSKDAPMGPLNWPSFFMMGLFLWQRSSFLWHCLSGNLDSFGFFAFNYPHWGCSGSQSLFGSGKKKFVFHWKCLRFK